MSVANLLLNNKFVFRPVNTKYLLIIQVVSYNAPFFTTWFCTNWTVLFFPLYFICRLISTKCESPGNIMQESVRNFRDKGFTAGKHNENKEVVNSIYKHCFMSLQVQVTADIRNRWK
jgi:hypothetical protein